MKKIILLSTIILLSCNNLKNEEKTSVLEQDNLIEELEKVDIVGYFESLDLIDKSNISVYIFEVSGVEKCLFRFEKNNAPVYPNFTAFDIRMYGHGAGMGLIRRFDDLHNYTSPFKVPYGYYGFESYESNRPKKNIKRQFVLPLTIYGDIKNIFDKIKIRKGYRNIQFAVDFTVINVIKINLDSNGKPVFSNIFKKKIIERDFELDISL
ncbi:MAG: hypothetical protein JXQ93_11530 [Flavobacteriaceae bacterium]